MGEMVGAQNAALRGEGLGRVIRECLYVYRIQEGVPEEVLYNIGTLGGALLRVGEYLLLDNKNKSLAPILPRPT